MLSWSLRNERNKTNKKNLTAGYDFRAIKKGCCKTKILYKIWDLYMK